MKVEITNTGGEETLTVKYEASFDDEHWFEWDIINRCPYNYLREVRANVECDLSAVIVTGS